MQAVYEFAVELTKRSGEIPLRHFRKDLAIERKPDASPVTIADRETEMFMRAEIEKRFPDDGIIGEEYDEKPGTSGRKWILDPIDGTQVFVRGLPLFGCMAAVVMEGESRIGAIHYPAMGETISALKGHGCFYNGQPCHVSEHNDLAKAVIATSYPHKIKEMWGQKTLDMLIERTAMVGTYDCYGYLMVATGRADLHIEPTLKLWDIAPLFPIIQEAGGIITDRDGNARLGIESIVMGNPAMQGEVLEMVKEKMKR